MCAARGSEGFWEIASGASSGAAGCAVGSDGAGTHAVATLGGLIFDAAERRALPLSRAALDHCVGAQLNGARFSHVARAVRLVPGKSLRKRLRRAAGRGA